MVELDRARLVQERWFSLVRWLLIEATLFLAYLAGDLGRALDSPISSPLVALTAYTILVTILVTFLRRWSIGMAYATAIADTVFAVILAASEPAGIVSPALVGVAAASMGVGVRRFPIFETFSFSFIIAVGIIVARFNFVRDLTIDTPEVLVVAGAAILPILARAVTLAPQEGGRDDPMARLTAQGLALLARLPADATEPARLFHAAAQALATYSNSPLAGVLVRNSDQSYDLYSSVEGKTMSDHLPTQGDDQIASRIASVQEAAVWSRRDHLETRGLPDQYPGRLDSLLVVPLPNVSPHGAALFLGNRRGGNYRTDDRVVTVLIAREMARILLTLAVDQAAATTRNAASEALLASIEAKRIGSRDQAEECARLAIAVAAEMGWSGEGLEELRVAALLHDVGELAVPDVLLDKTEPLAPHEFEIIRNHPRIAARIIDYFNHSPIVLNAVYSHHERWDGRGYPNGLEGENIPLEARILSLADSMESMLSAKPFRPALPGTDALQEVVKASGTQFDPSVVQAFLAVLQREGPTFLERKPAENAAFTPDWGRSRVG